MVVKILKLEKPFELREVFLLIISTCLLNERFEETIIYKYLIIGTEIMDMELDIL